MGNNHHRSLNHYFGIVKQELGNTAIATGNTLAYIIFLTMLIGTEHLFFIRASESQMKNLTFYAH